MKWLLVALAALSAFVWNIGVASDATATDCTGVYGNINACTGSGDIGVTGTRGAANPHSNGSGESTPSPVGSTQLIACGTNAAGDLAGLGDPEAAADANSCTTAVPGCKTAAPGATGASIRVQKQADGTWTLNGSVCTKPARPVVTAAMVRDRVVRLIPTAKLGLAPHDSTLVNIQTIMWVDAPKTQQLPPLTILGQRVTVDITLSAVDWNFGDRHSASTNGPGKAYDSAHDPCRTATCPHYFGHTYRTSGQQRITATAAWTASFTVGGGRAATIPGTVAGPTANSTVVVKQARSVLVPDSGRH